MFALTCLAAWVQASVGWELPTLSKFAAPALALIAAGGTMLWLRRDRASSAPVVMAATLLVLTIPLSLTMYVRVMFSILFAAMSVDPGG